MKQTFFVISLIILLFGQKASGAISQMTNQPDSVCLFSYSTEKNAGRYVTFCLEYRSEKMVTEWP